ncbi:MAG TPA: hypothetical protein VGN64_04120 [Dyadobacter sp.]|jgi:hypothetical protein|nr:hypothetical protein [Dyadobacter sp.]
MFDKEIEAIAKCTDLIKDLDGEAKMRVIKYLIERFGIGANSVNNSYPTTVPSKQQLGEGQFTVTPSSNQIQDIESEEYPSLKQLVVKNYPKNEAEWVLCYSFLSSKFGSERFSKESLIEGYKETNRYSETNRKNVTNSINSCIKRDWIKDVNKDDYILKPEGIAYAKEVLKGNSSSKEVKRVKKNKINTGQLRSNA